VRDLETRSVWFFTLKPYSVELRILLIKRFESCSAETMSAGINAIRRWQRWCASHAIPWYSPSAQDMAAYCMQGGPIASRNLAWSARHLKLDLKLNDELVSPWWPPTTGFTAKGASRASLAITVHWEALVQATNASVRQSAAANIVRCLGVLGYKHGQRSLGSPNTTGSAVAFGGSCHNMDFEETILQPPSWSSIPRFAARQAPRIVPPYGKSKVPNFQFPVKAGLLLCPSTPLMSPSHRVPHFSASRPGKRQTLY